METRTPVLPKGKKVTLGDGRKGVIVRKEERVGFHGYIVEITDSKDESQVGTTVGATIPGLKWGQVQTNTNTGVPVVSGVATELPMTTEGDPQKTNEKLKKLIEQQTRDKQQELQNVQRQITMMQAVGQMAPQKPPQQQDLEQNLEQQEQSEEQELDEQQVLNMQNQMMQQNTQTQQQMNVGQQQMLMKQSSIHLAHPERADVEIRLDRMAVLCDVAATPKQQATGLQVYDSLPRNRGLWFPQYARRTASFHMGDVHFPIDIVFVDHDRVTKIVSGIQPRQMGAWSALCTDVIEVNGGWCADNSISVGSKAATPLTGKKQARSELERAINRSWSAPQDARITSGKSYDLLRTITEASPEEDTILQQIEELIPELKKTASTINYEYLLENLGAVDAAGRRTDLTEEEYTQLMKIQEMYERAHKLRKLRHRMITQHPWQPDSGSGRRFDKQLDNLNIQADSMAKDLYSKVWQRHKEMSAPRKRAQENYKVKPNTYNEQPGEVDLRNPTDRFRHSDVPLIGGGEDGVYYNPINPKDPGVTQFDKNHYDIQVGSDPLINPKEPIEERDPAEVEMVTRPASKRSQIQVNTPNVELAGVDTEKLAKSSLRLYIKISPEWGETTDPRGYNKMAVINDQLISNWIGSLGFDDRYEAKLRQVMFTNEYKRLLGDSLVSAHLVSDFDIFGSDLLLYKRE